MLNSSPPNLLSRSAVIREPVGFQSGYWAGAPGAFFAEDEQAWYLTYRIRRPRGVAPDRGGEARIARSTDLRNWADLWSVTKDKFNSSSIERCALIKSQDRVWRYFVSYVDPRDGRWCLSVLSAKRIEDLRPEHAKPVFKAAALQLEGIKDPWIMAVGGKFYMFLSVALPTSATTEQSHSTLDIYNTGECVSATGLATSEDLENWDWQGIVFAPQGQGWDQYCRRINSVVCVGQQYFAFYDGSASHAENYEERTGVAVSDNLLKWESLTKSAPLLTSPNASGCLRYIDAQIRAGEVNVFFELARPDRAHEMRLTRVPVAELAGDLLPDTKNT